MINIDPSLFRKFEQDLVIAFGTEFAGVSHRFDLKYMVVRRVHFRAEDDVSIMVTNMNSAIIKV